MCEKRLSTKQLYLIQLYLIVIQNKEATFILKLIQYKNNIWIFEYINYICKNVSTYYADFEKHASLEIFYLT